MNSITKSVCGAPVSILWGQHRLMAVQPSVRDQGKHAAQYFGFLDKNRQLPRSNMVIQLLLIAKTPPKALLKLTLTQIMLCHNIG
jgi:hypothetical protein